MIHNDLLLLLLILLPPKEKRRQEKERDLSFSSPLSLTSACRNLEQTNFSSFRLQQTTVEHAFV